MEGWVNPGPGKEQLAHGCYATACGQRDSNPDLAILRRARKPVGYRVTKWNMSMIANCFSVPYRVLRKSQTPPHVVRPMLVIFHAARNQHSRMSSSLSCKVWSNWFIAVLLGHWSKVEMGQKFRSSIPPKPKVWPLPPSWMQNFGRMFSLVSRLNYFTKFRFNVKDRNYRMAQNKIPHQTICSVVV